MRCQRHFLLVIFSAIFFAGCTASPPVTDPLSIAPNDFSLEAEAKGMETAPIYFDNEEALTLMIFVKDVFKSVPESVRRNTEYSAKSLPPLFWVKIAGHSTVWMSEFASVTQKREAHIELLNLLVPNLKAFVQIGSLFVR